MLASLLSGSLLGLGLVVLVRALVRPRPGLATLVARIDAGQRSMRPSVSTPLERSRDDARPDAGPGAGPGRRRDRGPFPALQDRLEVLAAERGWRLGRVRSDLAVMNRTMGSLLTTKVLLGLALMAVAPSTWAAIRMAGVPVPLGIPLAVAVVLGLLGFVLPDLALRAEADRRRQEFRRTVGIFLDLVAMNLAGGRGLPEALLTASTISEHWSLVRIRQALANARLLGMTPWQALGELGEDLGVDELRDLSGALALAADDGAKIRASLAARAATLRRKELADAEGEAGEKSQSMLVAQLLICSAFLIFLAFPAVIKLLGTT